MRLLCVSNGREKRICSFTVATVGGGEALTFRIVISRSFKVVVEKRMEAWNGTTGGPGPGGREDEAGKASSRGFDEPPEDPFASIKDRHPGGETATEEVVAARQNKLVEIWF
jgi:hypothetical protein